MSPFALGRTLVEETAACLLGGYGIPADVGLAAFIRLRDAQLLAEPVIAAETPTALAERIRALLAEPLDVHGRRVRYRFAAQKAAYVAAATHRLVTAPPPLSLHIARTPEGDRALRDWLLTLPGVGLKTASWIVRNHRRSDAVAVLDVHIVRAGRTLRLFRAGDEVSRHYREMEARYLAFATGLGVSAAELDDVMWRALRRRLRHERDPALRLAAPTPDGCNQTADALVTAMAAQA